ncbi:MAG: hypothetical protein ACRENI_13130 [Gemmatimonadaceae bacterium]
MRQVLMLPLLLVLVLAACPGDDDASDSIPVDTMPVDTVDLGDIATDLPPPAPDTFTPRTPRPPPRTPRRSVPDAPPALMRAVEREQAFSTFCYREFGLKSDPSLYGTVAMIVTVGGQGISQARVADSNWSSQAGSGVDRCLNERAALAWKLAPGAVSSGQYVVPLSFSGG